MAIANVQTNDGGAAYQVVLTNNYGSATSVLATLTVVTPVQILGQPASEAVLLGGDAMFAVAASGSGPLTFQWYFNGAPLSDGGRVGGSSTSTLTILNVQPGDAGGYKVVVGNPGNATASRTASLTPQSTPGSSGRYVALNSANSLSPYLGWSTAATNIQDAVDAAVAGDFVVVSNGTYNLGGRVVYGAATNRVVVDKAITVQSVNGPAQTLIQGYQVYGNNAVRCVYLTNNALLVGFTLTNGATRTAGQTFSEDSGGGVWSEWFGMVSNCLITGNGAASGYGGGAFGGTLINCVLTNNYAGNGGGAAASNSLLDCTLVNNRANPSQRGDGGGGACYCTLSNCVVTGNFCNGGRGGGGTFGSILTGCVVSSNVTKFANGGGVCFGTANNSLISSNQASYGLGNYYGGGAYSNVLNHCTLQDNQAAFGGGAAFGVLTGCAVSNNVAGAYGGGVYFGSQYNSLISSNRAAIGGGAYSNVLNNCILEYNLAGEAGGGAYACALFNCTVVSNTASYAATVPLGGGVFGGGAWNCVIYYNLAGQGSNFYFSSNMSISYCCTVPTPTNGSGNIANLPLFVNLAAGDYHLQSKSPCINAGINSLVGRTTDFDGSPRIVFGTVDIGAYEYPTPSSILSYAWAQQYGLATDGTADFADTDGIGMNNWQKWIAGLNPTNPASVLAMSPLKATNNSSGIKVTWQSVNTRNYYLQRSTNIAAQPAFSAIQSNLVGQTGTTSFTDTSATNDGPYFYRVGVQ